MTELTQSLPSTEPSEKQQGSGRLSRSRPRTLIAIIAFAILYVGLSVRFESLNEWLINPGMSMVDGEPLLVNLDGYYYLSMARDILDDSYGQYDELRGYPNAVDRTFPPPLLSLSAAHLAALSGLSLNWVAMILPPALGVLLAIPVFGIGRLVAGNACGALAAALALLSPIYIGRTSMGWFDTDVLLVTFVSTSVWLGLLMHEAKPRLFPIYLGLGMLNWILGMWWWDQAPYVATILTLSPILLALLLAMVVVRREIRWAYVAVVFASALALAVAFFGVGILTELVHKSLSVLGYVTKQEISEFPNIGITVGEQARLSFFQASRITLSHWVLVVASFAGVALCLWTLKLRALYFTALIGLTALGFVSAMRFLIFAAPVLSIGLAVLVFKLVHPEQKRMWKNLGATLLGGGALLTMLLQALNAPVNTPSLLPSVVREISTLNSNTEKGSVVWSDWGLGYPIHYWADRATVTDGQLHGPERSAYNYKPYATTSFEESSRFIAFYLAHGIAGVREFYDSTGLTVGESQALLSAILSEGEASLLELSTDGMSASRSSEQWREFLFPPMNQDAFLTIHYKDLLTIDWWYWLGTWNVDTKQGYSVFNHVRRDLADDGAGNLSDDSGFRASISSDTYWLADQEWPINRFVEIRNGNVNVIAQYDNGPIGMDVFYFPDQQFLLAQHQDLSQSVFSRLFIWGEDSPLFEPISTESELFKVWRVNPPGTQPYGE